MEEMSLAEFGELFSHDFYNLLDQYADAVKADDLDAMQRDRVEIIGAITSLMIGAAALARVMPSDEVALILGAKGGLN